MERERIVKDEARIEMDRTSDLLNTQTQIWKRGGIWNIQKPSNREDGEVKKKKINK